ncbi:MAG: aspartate/glutamate racemase family protein [Campylobacteraceae bacterium]|nr:aspartate/glutamate racemase family protein [Campylobacteraceae bacterium]
MKRIGMLGGMSWESTSLYYKIINEEVNKRLGSLHSAKIILSSVDFYEIEKLQHLNKWNETAYILGMEAKNIENAKADFLIICTNTMHKVYTLIQDEITIPILHIADATAEVLVKDYKKNILLLGTKFTMSEDFYKNRLINNYDLNIITPNSKDQDIIHKIIYEELCLGIINSDSKDEYLRIINNLNKDNKLDAVILGCTEITMLINQNDINIDLYDTTKIHALKAVDYALS